MVAQILSWDLPAAEFGGETRAPTCHLPLRPSAHAARQQGRSTTGMRSKNALRSLFLAGAISLLVVLAFGGGTAGAAVLHPLNVTATAHGLCTWGITKTAPSHLTLAVGEGYDIPYTVDVTRSCS